MRVRPSLPRGTGPVSEMRARRPPLQSPRRRKGRGLPCMRWHASTDPPVHRNQACPAPAFVTVEPHRVLGVSPEMAIPLLWFRIETWPRLRVHETGGQERDPSDWLASVLTLRLGIHGV